MKKFLVSLCLVLGVVLPVFANSDAYPWDKAPNKLNDLSALQNGAKNLCQLLFELPRSSLHAV